MKEQKSHSDKLYFSIGEVSSLLGVNPSLIRYWEQEFPNLKPHKNRKGERSYMQKDIDNLKKVYHLVKEKGFTLEGAKKELNQTLPKSDNAVLLKKLKNIKLELIKLKNQL